MKNIVYITGTRADYGLMRSTLHAIQRSPHLKLTLIATGMHLMDEFGKTIDEVKKDKFDVSVVQAVYEKDDKASMAKFIGEFIVKLTQKIKELKPDVILILGDRAEMLAGAIVGVYLGVPVAHIHGGDVSSTVDDLARHAITKLAAVHFPATKNSEKNILAMGEEKSRCYVVGAPGLDELTQDLPSEEEVRKLFALDDKPIAAVIQHPVSDEVSDAQAQVRATLNALCEFDMNRVVICPNADAGGRAMISVIDEYQKKGLIKSVKSLSRDKFLGLLNCAAVLLGNSSSGIIEAASFGLPVVNIGTRQKGRERSANVIDAAYDKESIVQAINTCLDPAFKKRLKNEKNVYGDGKTGERIANLLEKIDFKSLRQKRLVET